MNRPSNNIRQETVSAWEPDNIKVVEGETAEMDRVISEMYQDRYSNEAIGKVVGICASSVARRISRMIKHKKLERVTKRSRGRQIV